MAQEDVERPLLLLVAAGRAHASYGLPSRSASAGRERRPRPRARRERRRQPFLEPEHLRARPERPAERGNHRRALQPAAARRRRDDVARSGQRRRGERCRRGSARRRRRDLRRADDVSAAGPVPGAARPRRRRRRARRRSSLYSRDSSRSSGTSALAVERVAVGEGELRALGDDVDVLGSARARRGRSRRAARAAADPVGPWPHGRVLQTVRPPYSSVAGGSSVARQRAMSSPVRRPPSAATKRSISSATKPS